MTDSKGFTLLEVMISVAIFAIAAYLLSDFNQIYTNDNYSMKRACEAHAAAVISAVQEQTYYMQIINPVWDTTVGEADNGTGSSKLTYSASNFLTTPLLPNKNDYLTGNINTDHTIYYSSSGVSQYNGHYLIQGSLRTLAAIYNKNGVIQCKMGSYAPLTDGIKIPMPGILANLPTKPVIQMELDPYALKDHSSRCGTGALYPAPNNRGGPQHDKKYDAWANGSGTYSNIPMTPGPEISDKEATGNMSASNVPIAVKSPNSNTDIGIGMTVQISYVLKGKSYSCSATQEFQYPEDDSPPPTPNLAITKDNSTIISSDPNRLIDYCQGTVLPPTTKTGSIKLQMGYKNIATTLENGIELFCKDLSWQRVPKNTTYCKTPSGAKVMGEPYASEKFFADSGYQFIYNSTFGRFGYWQPCQKLTQCGVTPNSSTAFQSANNLYFENSYSGLPFGCVLNFEVVGIDTAGNRSGAMGSGSPDNLFLSDTAGQQPKTTLYGDKNFTVHNNEIYFPTCGKGEGSYYTYYHSGLGYYCPKYGYYNCNRWCGT